jgi:hypothetical protein
MHAHARDGTHWVVRGLVVTIVRGDVRFTKGAGGTGELPAVFRELEKMMYEAEGA